MRQVLVTGAGGYIGTTLVPLLIERGYRVRAVDRFFFGHLLPAQANGLEIVQEDVRHLAPTHFEGIDAVVDLAAVSNDPSGEAFQAATWQINRDSRMRTARLAKSAGVRRYVLASSCSVYGAMADGAIADETSSPTPLTTYARANLEAEAGVLPLCDDRFNVVALRQATVYGLSPRMRFDLAINGMTFGAWKTGRLPLMRDGTQWRPMLHVRDAAAGQLFALEAPAADVAGRIFNVGSDADTYQIGPLGDLVAQSVPRDVAIEWYGDPDRRSYRVAFDRYEALGFRTRWTAADGVREICAALSAGLVDRTPQTITLEWYKTLAHWHRVIRDVERHGGILDL